MAKKPHGRRRPGKADIKNGFLVLANDLAEEFSKLELSGADFRVLWAFIRKTYGWKDPKKLDPETGKPRAKKADAVSRSQIEAMTGLNRRTVSRSIQRLVGNRVLFERGGRLTPTSPVTRGINPSYKEWAGRGQMTPGGQTLRKGGVKRPPTTPTLKMIKGEIASFKALDFRKRKRIQDKVLKEMRASGCDGPLDVDGYPKKRTAARRIFTARVLTIAREKGLI
jgi:hypothetical protein